MQTLFNESKCKVQSTKVVEVVKSRYNTVPLFTRRTNARRVRPKAFPGTGSKNQQFNCHRPSEHKCDDNGMYVYEYDVGRIYTHNI